MNTDNNLYSKENILKEIDKIRKDIGHDQTRVHIKKIYYNKDKNEMCILTEDRPDKSAIIGKGGWVIGKLREKLKIDLIHVKSYKDYLLKKYELELSKRKINEFENNSTIQAMGNFKVFLDERLDNIYNFDFNSYFENSHFEQSDDHEAVVALSGGVDSSFSLIIAKKLGFNPWAVTIDPGTIVLPNQFKKNINRLTKKLNIDHRYIEVDYSDFIKQSLDGRFHPCGRCSKNIENRIYEFAKNERIALIIYGDMLSTGTQCITKQDDQLYRLNLPASLAVSKQDIKYLTRKYDLAEFQGFGCPLLYEVHKKYPHLKKYSIQRILRETRSGALEPGEALDLIWSFYKTK